MATIYYTAVLVLPLPPSRTHRDVRAPQTHTFTNGSGEISSFHSRSQEVLPMGAHFDNSIATRGTYNDSKDGSHSDVNVGYGVSHLHRGSDGNSQPSPSTIAHGSRPAYQVRYSISVDREIFVVRIFWKWLKYEI